MSEEKRTTGLGRGLDALMGAEAEDYASLDKVRAAKEIPIENLKPNPFQPRRRFDADDIAQLVQSVREKGVLQPLLVRRMPGHQEFFEIIAGERRWRAAQQAQLHQLPVVIKELADSEALEIALIENIQRADLTALEEAEGYQRLMDEFEHTQEALARVIGKSRSHIANTLRLLNLPDAVKELVDNGELTAGHARALLAARNPVRMAKKVVKKDLNVRQVEALVQQENSQEAGPGEKSQRAIKPADTVALEGDISAAIGLKVDIKHDRTGGGGALKIQYQTLEQLEDVCRRLCQLPEAE